MMKLNTMRTRLDGLVIFRGILQANIVPAFRAMLAAAGSEDFVSAAADFENQLFFVLLSSNFLKIFFENQFFESRNN